MMAVAILRSLSENHLLQIIYWQLRMNGAEHACRIVPISTGQKLSVSGERSLNIAPKYYNPMAKRSTVLVE